MSVIQPILDHSNHCYSLSGRSLTSVTTIINALLKKSIDGVDPAILKSAAERGSAVETYATELLRTGHVALTGEREDVIQRMECFEKWWLNNHGPRLIEAQKLVFSEEDGIAGTLDWLIEIDSDVWLLDLKCTAQPEASWQIQVGAYAFMSGHHGPAGVLHINPKYSDGYILRQYDTLQAVRQWRAAVAWYRALQELKQI